MGNILNPPVFEPGSVGAAFIGRVFARLRRVSRCRVILSMESTDASPPTVANFHLTVAFVVSFLFFHTESYLTYIFIYSFLVDLTRLHHKALLVSDYQNLPIRKSHHDRDIGLVHFFNISEPGDHPDMDSILPKFLSATMLEELPYIEGYCGEFCEGITQKAGPRRIPGLSVFFKILLFLNIYIRHLLGQ
jgi:hypothetical protein